MRPYIFAILFLSPFSSSAQEAYIRSTSSELGAQVLAAMSSLPKQAGFPAGTIIIPPGTYTQTVPVSIASPYVSVVSRSAAASVQIQCAPSMGSNPCWRITTLPFSVMKAGTFGGFTLNGPGAYVAGSIGIEAGGIISATFKDLVIQGFSGLSSVGMLWTNPPSAWSERIVFNGVHLNGNSTGLKFIGSSSSADFFYWNVQDLQLNVPSDGVGIDLENDSQVVGGFWKVVANTNVSGGTATLFLVNGASMFGSDCGFTSSSPLVNTVHITADNSGQTSPVTFWSVAKGAKVNVSGNIEGTSNSVYRNSIEGTFVSWLANSFIGSSTPNYTDLGILAHGMSGNPANSYILRFENPATTSTLYINNPGKNAAFVFDTGNQVLTNKVLSNPAISSHLNQAEKTQFAGNSACLGGVGTVTFRTAFKSIPAILVFDETTKNGISLTGKSTSSFAVSCSGFNDNFSWMAIGNPD
ncbi:MAG TPA: hypothetical protein VIW23_01260 [Candidatus Acidoferrum sp.]|jgi:hypothetical protein